MLDTSLGIVYNKFQMHFFKMVFEVVREKDGSLSAMEVFSLQVIALMGYPTVGEFANFLGISQSNATYKVNSLIKKGYLEREMSQTDRREFHLSLSKKYYYYFGMYDEYQKTVMNRIKERFSEEDVEKLDEILTAVANEMMPEAEI